MMVNITDQRPNRILSMIVVMLFSFWVATGLIPGGTSLLAGTFLMSQSAIDWTDSALAERWERIAKVENLQADTNLKQAQSKVVVWQVVASAFTAGGAVVGSLVALAAVFLHGAMPHG